MADYYLNIVLLLKRKLKKIEEKKPELIKQVFPKFTNPTNPEILLLENELHFL